jgi:hypothetical protein
MSWEVFHHKGSRKGPRITVTARGAIMLNREALQQAERDVGFSAGDRVSIFFDRETGRFGLTGVVVGDGVATARASAGYLAIFCMPFVRWFDLAVGTWPAEIYDHDGRKLIGFRKTEFRL